MIANLLHPSEPATFANIDRLIPESEELTKRELNRIPRPRIMKSHQYFDPRYPRVVYLVRDPRDVGVSQYHFFRKRCRIEDNYPIQKFVTRFVAGLSDYGSWGENVNSWVTTRYGHAGFLLLRYEDMVERTDRELSKVAQFLGISATPGQLARSIELSSAQRMRKLESVDTENCSVTKAARQDIAFVRSAHPGDWRSSLPRESVAEIEAAWGPIMRQLGYEPVSTDDVNSDHSKQPVLTFGEPAR